MTYRVLIGADFGSTVILNDGGRVTPDSHSKWQVALSVGATFLPLETVDGVSLPGDAFTCDRDGNTPPMHVILDDSVPQPGELWAHRVGAAMTKGWYRIRLGGGGGTYTPPPETSSVAGVQDVGWWWDGSSIASGVAADALPIFRPSKVTDATPQVRLAGGLPTGPTVVQWKHWDKATGLTSDFGAPVTVPNGATYGEAAPLTADIPEGLLWPEMVTAPPAGSGSSTAASVVAAATPYNSAAATVTAATLPLPAGGADGDTVFALVTSFGAIPKMPAAWTQRGIASAVASGTSAPRARLVLFTAPWAADRDMGMTLEPHTPPGGSTTTSSPVVASVWIMRSVDPANPVVDRKLVENANANGAQVDFPAFTATGAADFVFAAASWSMPSGTTGQTSAATPAGTEMTDAMTSRASLLNEGQNLTRYGALAAGASFAATSIAVSGGTGSTTSGTTIGMEFSVKRAPGVSAPTKITAWMPGIEAADTSARVA